MFGTKSPDPLIRVGSIARLIGVLLIVAPLVGALTHFFVTPQTPNRLFDPLPAYSPTAISYRHPVWVAVSSAPIGLSLVVAATRFLKRQLSSLVAIQRFCWAGTGVCALLGVLSGVSLRGITGPELLFFTIVSVVLYISFALMLAKLARQLDSSQWRERFERGRD